jgi:hypothetical protein
MAPNNSKLTIHPWLDPPLYNRIRYPQWKIYLYNAAQKLCIPLNPTGAYCLVARDADWEAHPKNITPSRPPSPGCTLHPAVIRVRPIIALPPFYTRTATTYEREVWKLEKDTFEKFDEAETILHTAIVESLSQGTICHLDNKHTTHCGHIIAVCPSTCRSGAQTLQHSHLAGHHHSQNRTQAPFHELRRFHGPRHRSHQSLRVPTQLQSTSRQHHQDPNI